MNPMDYFPICPRCKSSNDVCDSLLPHHGTHYCMMCRDWFTAAPACQELAAKRPSAIPEYTWNGLSPQMKSIVGARTEAEAETANAAQESNSNASWADCISWNWYLVKQWIRRLLWMD